MKKRRRFLRSKTRRSARERSASRFVMAGAMVASAALSTRLATPAHASGRLAQAPSSAQATQTRAFNIPAGPLGDALAAFEVVSGLRITLADPAIRDIQSPGVSGTMSAEQAIQRLLAGTAVEFRFADNQTVTLAIAARSEFVEVTGTAEPAVSSPKFTEPLRNIPQTVTVITSDVIQAQGVTSLRDVLRNVPGVTFQAGEGGGGLPGDTFTMRGFSSRNDVFIDGIRDAGGYSRDAFNLEQVEVIKGPSSAIAGRGATGGAVNQVTKTPHLESEQSATIGLGTAEFRRGSFDLNRPIEALGDGTAFRLNAMWTDSGVAGRDVVANRSWGVAPSLAIGLNSPTQLSVKYQHLAQDNVPDYGLPWGSYPDFPTGAFEATPPIDQSNFYGLENYDFEDIRSDVATVDLNRTLPRGMTLRNATRFSDTERDSAITAPRPPNRQLQRRNMGNTTLANQTNLTALFGRGTVQHELVTGLELSRERTENRNSAQSTNQPAVNIVDPDPSELALGPMPAITGNPSETLLKQVGLYAFDTVKVGERWQFSGGLRWDIVDTDYALTTLATGDVTRLTASDRMVSWRGGAIYKPRPNGSVYLGFGTSFDPAVDAGTTGAALASGDTAANNPNLEPEETRNYEVGTKWDLAGGRLSVNGAVFRTEKVNARTRNANNEPFVLSGRQRVSGVELGVSGHLTRDWSALVAYALLDSEIAASANVAEEGQNLTLTPESTFSLWTTYQVHERVSAGVGAQFMDAVFRNTINTQEVPSYWLANALVSYRVNENLSLRVNVQNLKDEQYVDRVGGGHYIPGPRRQAQFSADVRF